MPPVVVGAAITTAVSVGAAYVTGAVITYGMVASTFATSVVLNYAAKQLMPKPKIPGGGLAGLESNSHLVSRRESNATRVVIYGRTKISGPIGFTNVINDDKNLGMTVLLAVGEVEEIEAVFFDDDQIGIDANHFITGPHKYAATLSRVQKFVGSSNQTSPSILAPYDYPESSVLTDVAYLALDLSKDMEHMTAQSRGIVNIPAIVASLVAEGVIGFPNGVPNISAIVKGRKVFDPRTGSTDYSQNPALVIRDYLTNETFGVGVAEENIDDLSFIVAANICDEQVDLTPNLPPFAKVSERRYTFNGAVDTGNSLEQNLENMLTSLAGTLYQESGKWALRAGAYVTPTVTLSEDDLAGPLMVTTAVSQRESFNAVKGQFRGPSTSFQATDYPFVLSQTFLEQDNNRRTFFDFNLPFTDKITRARRIAKIALNQSRQTISVVAKFKLTAFRLSIGDTVMINNERFGFENKVFQVMAMTHNFKPNDTSVDCHLIETNADVYNDSEHYDEQEQDFVPDNSRLPDPLDLTPPSIEITDVVKALNQAATSVLVVRVFSSSIYARRFEVQAKKATDTEYVSLGAGAGNIFELPNVEDNATYDVRARMVNAIGVTSEYTTGQHQVVGKTAPPQNVTNFTVNIVGENAYLSWTAVTDADLSHYVIRHTPNTTNAIYSDSVDLIPRVGRPAVEAIAPAMTGTYFIKAVDKLGNESVIPASSVAIIKEVKGFNLVTSLTEHPNFLGQRSGVAAVDGKLVLDTTSFDSTGGNFDSGLGDFDGAGGNVASIGTYEFKDYIDLQHVFQVRVSSVLVVERIDYVNTFDSRQGNFDDAPGLFDGDVTAAGDTNVELFISVTDDDPQSSPTWSPYRRFVVTDLKARALRFKAVLTSKDEQASPRVSQLQVKIDMPDRQETVGEINTNSLSGSPNYTVEFIKPFKVLTSVIVAGQDLEGGENYSITNRTATGFTITFVDSNNQPVTASRTFDYTATGYGEVET